MRHNAFFKLLAILVSVVCVVCLIPSGFCVVANISCGLYTSTPQEQSESRLDWHSWEYANSVAEEYAFAQSGMARELWSRYFDQGYFNTSWWPYVDYILVDEDGNSQELSENRDGDYVYETMITVSLRNGQVRQVGEDWEYYPEYAPFFEPPAEATLPNETIAPGADVTDVTAPTEGAMPTDPTTVPEAAETLAELGDWYSTYTTGDGDIYVIYQEPTRTEYQVSLFYTREDVMNAVGNNFCASPLGMVMYEYRYAGIAWLVGSAVVLILMMTYLACAAGRKPGTDEVRPGGMNRLPLDLYAAADCFIGFWLVWAFLEITIDGLFEQDVLWNEGFWVLALTSAALCAAIGLICILFWTALCAQVKTKDGFWWKNTLIGRFGKTIWRFITGLFGKLLGVVTGVGGKMGEKVPSFTDMLRDFNDKLPLMWQWLGASLVMFAALAVFGSVSHMGVGMFIYAILVIFGVLAILYGARAFGALRDAAKRMSQGNLDAKINADSLEGCFRDFAKDLNALSDACVVAAREQLKSERMKTELITNVSHDIKTPLTSIINYVDLLQKAETEEQRKEYLAVLERQSAQLKKLIEDLMEMSKASSGNVAMELAPTDMAEAVHQALGEYADRFASLRLNVLLRKPEEQVMVLCDGKLLWRVMSNVMTNVVKYAMPGTRVYVDLTLSEFRAQLAIKNISREELNISAEELMERFVRGDESRNTEGNGLGLNIAKSLMELQGGTLELVVDGDLFKVILTLPRAEEAEFTES